MLTEALNFKRDNPKAAIPLWGQLKLLILYILGRVDVHGGYFDGAVTQRLIYRLACLGVDGSLSAYGDKDAMLAECADHQIRSCCPSGCAQGREGRRRRWTSPTTRLRRVEIAARAEPGGEVCAPRYAIIGREAIQFRGLILEAALRWALSARGRSMTTVWLCIGVAALAFLFGVAGLYLQKLLPEPHSVRSLARHDRSDRRPHFAAARARARDLDRLRLHLLCDAEIGNGDVRRPSGSTRPRAGRIRAGNARRRARG